MSTTFLYANNFSTTLGAAITSSGQTTITLSSTTNAQSPTGGQVWVITLCDAATRSVFEILYCTSRTGAVCTVLRGQEGTTATTWLVNDFVYGSATAGILNNFALINGSSSTNFAANALTVASGATIQTGAIGTVGATINGPPGQTAHLTNWSVNNIVSAFIDNNGLLNFAASTGANLPNGASIAAGATGNLLLNTTLSQPLEFTSGTAGATLLGQFNASGGLFIGASSATVAAIGDLGIGRAAAGAYMFWGTGANAGQADFGENNVGGFTFKQVSVGFAPIFAGAYTNSSDARLKSNIAPIIHGSDEIMALKPSSFTMKGTQTNGLGFIAQDVQLVLPTLVSTDADGNMGVNYDGIIPVLVKHCQDEVAIRLQMQAALKAAGIAGF